MINLGKTPGKISESKAVEEKKTYYPSLHVSDIDGLGDLPEGDFTFTGKGRVVSSTETNVDGKTRYTCEIEVHSIDPQEAKKPAKKKDVGDSLDESFDRIAKDKSEEDDSDDEE